MSHGRHHRSWLNMTAVRIWRRFGRLQLHSAWFHAAALILSYKIDLGGHWQMFWFQETTSYILTANERTKRTFESRAISLCTASLTPNNSTFCPHSVFMCFEWIWEQTAIISLYSIDWLVFITGNECVYCAVRTGYLYIILRSAHTVHLCVLYVLPNTTLTGWFLRTRRSARFSKLSNRTATASVV